MNPSSDLQAALAALPHGPEFCFLDRLTALVPGRTGSGVYKVRGDEPFLKGHFPGAPIMPGVLLLEAAAQLAGVVAQTDAGRPPLRELKLTAIKSVKIFGSAQPGEEVELRAQIVGRFGALLQAEVSASVLGKKILEGALALSGSE